MNLALMAKIGWRILTKKKSLWSKVVAKKYIKGTMEISKFTRKQNASNIWKGITAAGNLLSKGTRRKVYNGQGTLCSGEIGG